MCDVNDCVSQVKSLDPVLERKKAQKAFFWIHSTYCAHCTLSLQKNYCKF